MHLREKRTATANSRSIDSTNARVSEWAAEETIFYPRLQMLTFAAGRVILAQCAAVQAATGEPRLDSVQVTWFKRIYRQKVKRELTYSQVKAGTLASCGRPKDRRKNRCLFE